MSWSNGHVSETLRLYEYERNKYFSSNWASKAKQNILKCGEIGGRAITVEDIVDENLVLAKTSCR